jgi:hypothetical protein
MLADIRADILPAALPRQCLPPLDSDAVVTALAIQPAEPIGPPPISSTTKTDFYPKRPDFSPFFRVLGFGFSFLLGVKVLRKSGFFSNKFGMDTFGVYAHRRNNSNAHASYLARATARNVKCFHPNFGKV